MHKIFISLFLLLSFASHAALNDIKRIAFGSCNDQNDAQPLWKDVVEQKPDLWIWGGDAVYGDWKTTKALEEAFKLQNSKVDYQNLKSSVPMIGTWDDHDYAFDNADGTLTTKEASKKLYLDFVGEPANSPRRTREGIYTSYDFKSGGKTVKVILLDNRYFKNLDPAAPLLGKAQWEWLEEELKNSTASLHFFVTGLSIFSPLIRYTEEWGHYPKELNRLRALMTKYNPKGRVFLTGDKHFSSMFMRGGELEFMSSGMTHTVPRKVWWYLARKYATTFFGLAYGQIDIEWEGENPVIHMAMRGVAGRDLHPNTYRWNKTKWEWLK
ncbi:MAG TPA: alkaline phosphatase D family protein [Bacteriovoracaceae bacterium]|nr:alkaline phosphatase D family protein [Bacteriovoracaceae bacterium]